MALAQTMGRRGYEVMQSFVGSEWTPPRGVLKPADVQRLLYYRNRDVLQAKPMLAAVLSQLKAWSEAYRGMQVFWVVGLGYSQVRLWPVGRSPF